MSEIEEKLNALVDEVFDMYAAINAGDEEPSISRDKCCEFIKGIMEQAGEADAWDEEEFESCYREFDKDGGGSVSK